MRYTIAQPCQVLGSRNKSGLFRFRPGSFAGQSSKEKEEGEGAKEDAAGGAVTLTFEGVSCVIEPSKKQLKNGEELRTLLQSASGNAAPGRLLAVRV